jgi:hypothetical protein
MDVRLGAFEALSRAGQAQRFLRLYEAIIGEPSLTRNVDIDEDIRTYHLSETEREGSVLFPLIPGYGSLCRRFCVLAHAFRTKGYEPLVLHDDGRLPIRPENTVDTDRPRVSTESCLYRARRYPELFGLETISLSEAVPAGYDAPSIGTDDADELRAFSHDGVDLGGCAAASTRKYLKEYTLDLDDPAVRRLFKRFLRGGILLTAAVDDLVADHDIAAAVDQRATDAVLFENGQCFIAGISLGDAPQVELHSSFREGDGPHFRIEPDVFITDPFQRGREGFRIGQLFGAAGLSPQFHDRPDVDVERAITLVKRSLHDVGVDPDTGQFDADIIETGTSKSQRDRVKSVESVVTELEREKDQAPAVSEVMEKMVDDGFEKEKAGKAIDEALTEGPLYEPQSDKIRIS